MQDPRSGVTGGGAEPSRCKKGALSALDSLHSHRLPLANNSKLNPVSLLQGSVVVVCVFFPFPFPFSASVAHLLQSPSLQEPKLNKLPICHASLVVCSPHRHLAYLLSQKREREREREKSKKREREGRRGKEGRGRAGGGGRREETWGREGTGGRGGKRERDTERERRKEGGRARHNEEAGVMIQPLPSAPWPESRMEQ